MAEAAEEKVGSKDVHVPSVQDHKRTSIFSGARPRLAGNSPCGGGVGGWYLGVRVGGREEGGVSSYLCGPSQGARGRQHPAEEVIRVLPGAGSRERLGGSGSLSREI